nr:protein NPAT-like [Nerophis lumbriciformis]
MLLPSDVARLVLGYLQEEGLSATSVAFIQESPNLKEYKEHSLGDGALPACVFSVFGKGLTTILNEYMAVKTKETCHEVPAVMTSLWKKLDFTLKQIKSLQSSPTISSASQRARSRVGLANLTKQRVLTVSSASTSTSSLVCSSQTSLISSPAISSQSMLSHSTPESYSAPEIRAPPGSATRQVFHDGNRLNNIQRDSPIQIIISEQRSNPGPMSPGRRKWDTPRKRSGALGCSNGTGKSTAPATNITAEPQPEEVVDENFPQLVIQNARDKILGDRSLQEKLAENINKILANEPTPQTPKPLLSSMEDDQSIDEILGLQGEIHMSEDAIHDILKQTESDPAFQALFDLFDYNKTRTDGEPGVVDNTPAESDTDGPPSTSSTVGQPQSNHDPGATLQDTSDLTAAMVKNKAVPERKTRKPNSMLKKAVIVSSSKSSLIENSTNKVLNTLEDLPDQNRTQKASLFNHSVDVSPMDIDTTLDTSAILKSTQTFRELESVSKDILPTTMSLIDSTSVLLPGASATVEPVINVDNQRKSKQEQISLDQSAKSLPSQPAFLSPAHDTLIGSNSHTSVPVSCVTTQPQMSLTVTPQTSPTTFSFGGDTISNTTEKNVVSTCSPLAHSFSTTHTYLLGSSTFTSTASSNSSVLSPAESSSTTSNYKPPSKAATDSNNIVSLKIIISDNPDEDSPSDKTLSQPISSISTEKLPTIYLSSPVKSPRGPGTPRGNNLDETALAVRGLQSSEAIANSPSRPGALVPSHLMGTTTQTQQSYIIQLPLDTASTGLQAGTASYFLMTEPLTADSSGRQVQVPTSSSKVPILPKNSHFNVSTASPAQSFVTGSALILPSPVKPVMLPVSVVGQNSPGNVQMMANQTLTVESNLSTFAVKNSTNLGIVPNGATQNLQNAIQPHEPKDSSSSHKRILCFEPSTKDQPQTSKTATMATTSATNTSTSQRVTQTKRGRPCTRPAILSGNKPKRKIETVRLSGDSKAEGNLVTPISPPQKQNHVNTNSVKQDDILSQDPQTAHETMAELSQLESVKSSEPRPKLKSAAKKHSHNKEAINDEAKQKDFGSSKTTSDSVLKSISSEDKGVSSGKEHAEEQVENNTQPKDKPNIADKENKLIDCLQEQPPSLHTPVSTTLADLIPPAVTETSSSQFKIAKFPSKTSSLAIQATEMLQNIQVLNSPPKPDKTTGLNNPELTGPRTPGTGGNQTEAMSCPKTPLQQKKGKDAEGTPKNIPRHNTSEVPTCSPASEAGSENSINMAAHTLMILSRAAIARTGSPLKDSLRQEAGEKSPTSLKTSKKRKLSTPTASPPVKKSSKLSPAKKKKRERKNFMNCFPQDFDVDKFLSSLHYDE